MALTCRWRSRPQHHKRTLGSFDHLVGALLKLQGHLEAERFGGLEIDHQLEFSRPLDGQISRLVAL